MRQPKTLIVKNYLAQYKVAFFGCSILPDPEEVLCVTLQQECRAERKFQSRY